VSITLPQYLLNNAGSTFKDFETFGDWHYRWYSTGTGQGAEEKWFRVRQQAVP